MDITWHGNTCFTVKGKNVTLTLNPDKDAGKLKGELVLSSIKDPVEVEGAKKVFDWPGEYEASDVPIVGLQAWTKSKSKEEEEGQEGDSTLIFYFEVEGMRVCHLGELGHVLTAEMVNDIGDVDVLLIKAGSESNLSAKKAAEVVEEIDPRVLIPMGDGNFEEIIKELGISNVEPEEKFSIKSSSELPDDRREYVILKKV